MKANPLDTFKHEAPELQEAYAGVIDALIKTEGLDAKTKHLIFLAMKVVSDDQNAVKYHVPMAKAAGASREEIKDTILLSITVNGLKGISNYLSEALAIFEQ